MKVLFLLAEVSSAPGPEALTVAHCVLIIRVNVSRLQAGCVMQQLEQAVAASGHHYRCCIAAVAHYPPEARTGDNLLISLLLPLPHGLSAQFCLPCCISGSLKGLPGILLHKKN